MHITNDGHLPTLEASKLHLCFGAAVNCLLLLHLQAVGLPLCLSDLNLSAQDSSKLDMVVSACLVKPNLCLNIPMELTADTIKAAILQTDERGRASAAAAAAAAAAATK
jgi:hypothetical protein